MRNSMLRRFLSYPNELQFQLVKIVKNHIIRKCNILQIKRLIKLIAVVVEHSKFETS